LLSPDKRDKETAVPDPLDGAANVAPVKLVDDAFHLEMYLIGFRGERGCREMHQGLFFELAHRVAAPAEPFLR